VAFEPNAWSGQFDPLDTIRAEANPDRDQLGRLAIVGVSPSMFIGYGSLGDKFVVREPDHFQALWTSTHHSGGSAGGPLGEGGQHSGHALLRCPSQRKAFD
jgi:hypothetical protein